MTPGQLLKDTVFWQRIRHKVSLLTNSRENSTFTGFLRLPTQFDALCGPAIDAVRSHLQQDEPLNITVVGCSNGAEAYTILSVLSDRRPGLSCHVRGYDINADCVDKARAAIYRREEIFNNKAITSAFVEHTFDRHGDDYVVKPSIAGRAEFATGDVLSDALVTTASRSDIVFAQNFLFHLTRDMASRALENILRMTRPGSALLIDGTDLDLRYRFVRRHGLLPVEYEIGRIHDEARWARAAGWPYSYWGLEPFMTSRRDWQRRYATIFIVP